MIFIAVMGIEMFLINIHNGRIFNCVWNLSSILHLIIRFDVFILKKRKPLVHFALVTLNIEAPMEYAVVRERMHLHFTVSIAPFFLA